MPEQLSRAFSSISDSAATEAGQTMHDLMEDDLADFTAFDSDFDAAYLTAFQTAVSAASSHPTDESVVDGIEDLTQTVEEKMALCRTKFQDSKFFIEKAFPGRKGIHKQFGFDDYYSASRAQKPMVDFMDHFHSVANDKAAELAAVGYDAAAIAEIDTLRSALNTANRAQEKAIKNRPVITQERIEKLNAMWTIMQNVSKASKRIYNDNWAKFHQYLLPGAANNPEVDFNTYVIATSADDGSPIVGAIAGVPALAIGVNTDDDGKAALMLPEGIHDFGVDHPDYNSATQSINVLPGQVLNLTFSLTPT